jgi:hypothetical protein
MNDRKKPIRIIETMLPRWASSITLISMWFGFIWKLSAKPCMDPMMLPSKHIPKNTIAFAAATVRKRKPFRVSPL